MSSIRTFLCNSAACQAEGENAFVRVRPLFIVLSHGRHMDHVLGGCSSFRRLLVLVHFLVARKLFGANIDTCSWCLCGDLEASTSKRKSKIAHPPHGEANPTTGWHTHHKKEHQAHPASPWWVRAPSSRQVSACLLHCACVLPPHLCLVVPSHLGIELGLLDGSLEPELEAPGNALFVTSWLTASTCSRLGRGRCAKASLLTGFNALP